MPDGLPTTLQHPVPPRPAPPVPNNPRPSQNGVSKYKLLLTYDLHKESLPRCICMTTKQLLF